MIELNQLIVEATHLGKLVAVPDTLVPTTIESAYLIQDQLIKQFGDNTGAWKVGTGDHVYPVFASPIPNKWVYSNEATLAKNQYLLMGIELEYAFKLKNINKITTTISLTDLENHISEVAAAIEVVSTRLKGWPDLPPYLKAADLQSNGALIVGQSQPYCANLLNFNDPIISLIDNRIEKSTYKGKNPAGDPRLLLPEFVDQQRQLGRQVTEDHWVTTGSLSGIFFIDYETNITGTINGLPSVHLKVE